MIPSPSRPSFIQTAENLEPVSPKPAHYPSPSNIPILEKQMDPLYLETSAHIGQGTPTQSTDFHQTDKDQEMENGDSSYGQTAGAHTIAEQYQPTYQLELALNSQGTNAIQDFPQTYHDTASTTGEASLPRTIQRTIMLESLSQEHAHELSSASTPIEIGHGGRTTYNPMTLNTSEISNQNLPKGAAESSQPYMPQPQSATLTTPSSATLPPLPSNVSLPKRPPPTEKQTNQVAEDDIRSYHPHVRSGSADSDDAPWGPETQKIFDQFLEDERLNVTEGQWDKFPNGSRLFIGNLPTEKVTKRDLFHVFHKHGKLAQISLKQAYGFVQFLNTDSCRQALAQEQGAPVRGKKMHLEISKPQRNTGNAAKSDNNRNRRRSRSPDHSRHNHRGGVDRYTGGQGSPRDRDFRRTRDDYRPGRSPSPRKNGRRNRSRDRFRGSRSRSPPGRGRYRSPSPRRESIDDVELPSRAQHEVPDIEIIVVDKLDRNFIMYVENAFKDAGIRADVLVLSPRLSEQAVVRRQIVEGVLAISRLTFAAQQTVKIPLQIFDRTHGADNVRFEEYANLDIAIAIQLVLRDKQKQAAMKQPQYGLPASYNAPGPAPAQYGAQPGRHLSTPSLPPNFAAAFPSTGAPLDNQQLSQLMSVMQQQQAAAPPRHQQLASPTTGIPDLSHLFRNPNGQQSPGFPPPAANTTANPYASLAALLGTANSQPSTPAQPQQPSQNGSKQGSTGQPDMNQIMAQLAQYRR